MSSTSRRIRSTGTAPRPTGCSRISHCRKPARRAKARPGARTSPTPSTTSRRRCDVRRTCVSPHPDPPPLAGEGDNYRQRFNIAPSPASGGGGDVGAARGAPVTDLPAEVDVAVIGAGSAGIAAARRLAAMPGVAVLVLEARERAGGRAWTVEKNGYPCDLGGEWLHSADRNVLSGIAEKFGFAIYRRRPDWTTRLRNSGVTAAEQEAWIAAREANFRARHLAAREPEDRPASTTLPPGGRWNALLDASSTWGNAVELDKLSVKDNDRYEDSGVNWRVQRGYGTLLTTLAAPLPIAYGAAVSRIDHGGRDIVIDTG